ncbi:hypothetical protein BDK51DRAFT_48512, partial [Blyttiomyces helicus]
ASFRPLPNGPSHDLPDALPSAAGDRVRHIRGRRRDAVRRDGAACSAIASGLRAAAFVQRAVHRQASDERVPDGVSDSEYMGAESRRTPTIACWLALDDMTEFNGALVLEPYPPHTTPHPTPPFATTESHAAHHAAMSSAYPPQRLSSNSVLAEVKAGSCVFMSGHVLHCSLPNASRRFRRAWMPQFSAGAVMRGTGEKAGIPVAFAVPV